MPASISPIQTSGTRFSKNLMTNIYDRKFVITDLRS